MRTGRILDGRESCVSSRSSAIQSTIDVRLGFGVALVAYIVVFLVRQNVPIIPRLLFYPSHPCRSLISVWALLHARWTTSDLCGLSYYPRPNGKGQLVPLHPDGMDMYPLCCSLWLVNKYVDISPTESMCGCIDLILVGVHLGQAIWCRRWFLIPTLVLGGIGEIIGWSARLWSSIVRATPQLNDAALTWLYMKNIIADTPFLMQISTTIIAPTFLSAANFILLGTVINRAGPQYSRLSAKHCKSATTLPPGYLSTKDSNRWHDLHYCRRCGASCTGDRRWHGIICRYGQRHSGRCSRHAWRYHPPNE